MMVFGSYLHIFFFKFKYLVKFLIKSDFDSIYLKEEKKVSKQKVHLLILSFLFQRRNIYFDEKQR